MYLLHVYLCRAVCNQVKGWSYQPNQPNLPRDIYPYLISRIRVLIFNGDWDACVPYTDNQACKILQLYTVYMYIIYCAVFLNLLAHICYQYTHTCIYTGTEGMGFNTTKPWHPWVYNDYDNSTQIGMHTHTLSLCLADLPFIFDLFLC